MSRPPFLVLSFLFCACVSGEAPVRAQEDCFETIAPNYTQTDVAALIHIQSADDVASIRNRLIDFIWRGNGFPQSTQVQQVGLEPNLSGWGPLESYDRLTIAMDLGFESVLYHLRPPQRSGRLVIFHQGHSKRWTENGGDTAVKAFLSKGFSVLICQMPLFGENSGPAGIGRHNDMAGLVTTTLNPIKFFMEPVAIGLNHVLKAFSYRDVAMIGISGGGWTTTLYAAIDPRIRLSFPVAGSYPLYLRTEPCGKKYDAATGSRNDVGDWEQYYSELYALASYPDLYILGSYGPGRGQLQVLNQYDACCFGGIRSRTYEKTVTDAVAKLGQGWFDVFVDDSHRSHMISQHALDTVILNQFSPRLTDLAIEGTVDDPAISSVDVNGTPAAVISGTFRATRPTASGQISVTATDSHGNTATRTLGIRAR